MREIEMDISVSSKSKTTWKLLALACAVAGVAITLVHPAANGARAQEGEPIFDRTVLNQTVFAASASLSKLAALRRQLRRQLEFEDGSACITPVPIAAPSIDVHRTLFVHDDATLSARDFSLRRTLRKLSDDVSTVVPGTTPETIFRQFLDTQNDTPNQVIAGKPHCDDNNGKINGYPLNKCPRPEGIQATGMDAEITSRIDNDYKPLALVNRIDLADKGWKNCGEHRIVYGTNSGGKNLIIFEAVLPNPKPGCRSGCRDVIDFWLNLSSDPDPASRASKLEKFYYQDNFAPGFTAVVHTRHYSSDVSSVYGGTGSGQIRTNQFLFRSGMGPLPGPWTLKEFKTLVSCAGGSCDYDIMPISVKVNPYGVLWNRDVASGAVEPELPPENTYATPISGLAALAASFQADVLAQVTLDRLANPDLTSITYEVKPDYDAAESQSQEPVIDHFPRQFDSAADASFKNGLNTLAAPFRLTGAQIVNRATANSCAGCHLPDSFGLTLPNSIGPGVNWPSALDFVHVNTLPMIDLTGEAGFDPTQFGGNTQGFKISPALLEVFLPARRITLTNLANMDDCNCVPKPGVLMTNRALIPNLESILSKFSSQIKDQLASARKDFAGDEQQLFLQQRSIIAKSEAARDVELEKAGLKLPSLDAKIQTLELGKEKLSEAERLRLKTEKLMALIAAEPPRETITGSFRSH